MIEIASSDLAMKIITSNELGMQKVAASSVARTALYNSASVVEPILAKSPTALNALRNSAQFTTVQADSSSNETTLYNGKAFVLEVWSSARYTNGNHIHGKYIIGNNTISSANSSSHDAVNKFASSVIHSDTQNGGNIMYATIFKI